jgi:putative membrane protein insertion efficiency factor
VALATIDLYRALISPWLPPACRFIPTCSQYSREAFERYPPGRALWLSLRRLLRCQPFSSGGYDPVE